MTVKLDGTRLSDAGEVFKQRPAVLAALLDARIKENDKARNVSGLSDQEIQDIL